MTIQVKKLTQARLDETQQVYNAIFGDHPNALDFDDVAHHLAANTGLFYIAIDQATDHVIGFKFGIFETDEKMHRSRDRRLAGIPAARCSYPNAARL